MTKVSDTDHVEAALLAAYDQYAPSVSEEIADRCALAFREGFLAGHAEAEAELRAEIERLRVKAITDKEWIDGCHRALNEKDAQLDEVRRVIRSGIPIDREDALAAWRRLEAACQIYGA